MYASIKTLAFALALVLGTSQALAGPVGRTVWRGSETLTNNGILVFAFENNGTVVMADAGTNPSNPQTLVNGTWTQVGNNITIQFKDCIYQGVIQNGLIIGTARFHNNPSQTWTFQVGYMNQF